VDFMRHVNNWHKKKGVISPLVGLACAVDDRKVDDDSF